MNGLCAVDAARAGARKSAAQQGKNARMHEGLERDAGLMKDFSISVIVDAPPQRVWEVMSDIERWPDWTPTVISVRRTNSGPMRIGAKARVHQPRLPAADWVVTALRDGHGFDWES